MGLFVHLRERERKKNGTKDMDFVVFPVHIDDLFNGSLAACLPYNYCVLLSAFINDQRR